MRDQAAIRGAKGVIVSIICLWMAGGCQQSLAPRMAFAGLSPDFLLISLGCLGLCGSRKSGAVTGFFAGVIQGALAGANMAQYVVSRTLSGFLLGWLNTLEFDANAVVAFFAVFATTILSQLLLMFLAPPPRIIAFLLATIGSAVYNGVLAMPLFMLLKKVVDPPNR